MGNTLFHTFAFFLILALLSCGVGVKIDKTEAPSISGVSTKGNSDGSVTVTISGTNFVVGSTTVIVDGVACTPVTVLSSTLLQCTLPNGNIAMVNIVISTGSGGSSGGQSGSGAAFHTMFVTSYVSKGIVNLDDSICYNEAHASSLTSGLTGTWRLVISDHFGTTAKDRITFVNGASIKTPNGDTIVSSASQLWGGTLLHAVNVTATGATVSSGSAWTGTYADGSVSQFDSQDCGGWNDNKHSETGISGDLSSTSSTWINSGTSFCDGNSRFYCINSNN